MRLAGAYCESFRDVKSKSALRAEPSARLDMLDVRGGAGAAPALGGLAGLSLGLLLAAAILTRARAAPSGVPPIMV